MNTSLPSNRTTTAFALGILLGISAVTHGAPVTVPNGDFEDYEAVTPGSSGGWGSLPSGHTDVTPATLMVNDEFFTNPSNFGSGWQSNGPAGTAGKYGLQHPSDSFYERDAGSHQLQSPFNGDFIGFMNLDDADGFEQSVQSVVIGSLQPGTYTLQIGVGARANANWNDVKYDISLVADPIAGGTGTSGGTVLGTPASLTLAPFVSPRGSNVQDAVYTLALGADDPNIGRDFAIRIDIANTFMQNGVPDPNAPINGGTNARFTQGNFDNVRLDHVIPEPGSVALLAAGAALLAVRRRRTSLPA